MCHCSIELKQARQGDSQREDVIEVIACFEEDNGYVILVLVNGFGVTVYPERCVSMCKEAVLKNGDKSVQEI